ncbi:myotubularin-related protein 10-B isoform X3 [Cimex lectularius]|uniref:Myotubularin phosphatase domain-containing protein n=1 Tax=Cimex lectularius TaxID=79782 RepID=A0A8I6SD42_CIMLE|nr:myotubularin-related protein 10-B isoform X3 [Cimex lectularius]
MFRYLETSLETIQNKHKSFLNSSNDDSYIEHLSPRLIRGEALIAEAQNVLMFSPVRDTSMKSTTVSSQGRSGLLCVTSFKLSFITSDEKTRQEVSFEDVLHLGENDVCLTNVDSLYIYGDKKKKLVPGKQIAEKVKGLYVVCKNLRVLSFSFKFSPIGHGKTLTNTLLHHAFAQRHPLLFLYDYGELVLTAKTETNMFREAGDWGKELARTHCYGWRLSAANLNFHLSPSLSKWIVTPAKVVDAQLMTAAQHFRANRPPIWCWSNSAGAALVRMADIMPTITDRYVYHRAHLQFYTPNLCSRQQENLMLESIRKSHPKLTKPMVLDLTRELPSIRDIQHSFMKLRELCTPDDAKHFWTQDHHFLSNLENSKWLLYVSACLRKSAEAAEGLYDNITVVLQECDGRDLCCVIASLTQLLLDPHYRTIYGFQSLIQKEWVIMGHPFSTRLAHVYNPETVQSPVFLLFLDCVWQIVQQFPTNFQFTETYLTLLWETALVSIFDTFLFDCERDRLLAYEDPANKLTLRSVWDEILTGKDAPLLYNPVYAPHSPNITISYLPVNHRMPCLLLWKQCYFRHIPLLEIKGGGNPQIDFMNRLLLAQSENDGDLGTDSFSPDALSQYGSFFPFSRGSSIMMSPPSALLVSSLSLNTSFYSSEIMLDSQSILNTPD